LVWVLQEVLHFNKTNRALLAFFNVKSMLKKVPILHKRGLYTKASTKQTKTKNKKLKEEKLWGCLL
jgi:hypothetical protein